MSEAGRFQLLNHGQLLLPAKCISCGSADNKRQYIDLDISVEFFGEVYCCVECFQAVSEGVGYEPASRVEFWADKAADLQKANEHLIKENEALRNVLAVLLPIAPQSYSDAQSLIDDVVVAVQAAAAPSTTARKIPKQSKGSDESGS